MHLIEQIISEQISKMDQAKLDIIKQRFYEESGLSLIFFNQITRYQYPKAEAYYFYDIHLVTFFETEFRFDPRTQRYYIDLKYRF